MARFGRDPKVPTTISAKDAARYKATLREQVIRSPDRALDANNRRDAQRRRARLS